MGKNGFQWHGPPKLQRPVVFRLILGTALFVMWSICWPQNYNISQPGNGFLLTFVPAAGTLKLSDLWERTKTTEPSLIAARANVEVASQRLEQAKASFWPQVNASVGTNSNRRNYVQGLNTGNEIQTLDNYRSQTRQITLSLPLIKRVNNATENQAQLVLEQSMRQYESAEAELLSRLVSVWCEWLAASDIAEVAAAFAIAKESQYKAYQVGFRQGLYAVQQLEEINTKWQLARAEHHSSLIDKELKLANLVQLVGVRVTQDSKLRFKPPALLPLMEVLQIETLIKTSIAHNAAIKSAEMAVEAAQKEVDKQKAGHEPTLDLVATRSFNGQSTAGTFPGQSGFRNLTGTVGVQLNVPIFAGGGIQAKVREALALLTRADADLETARRNTVQQTTKAWAGLEVSKAKWLASMQAVTSARANLQQSELGVTMGLKTIADDLLSRHALEAAESDARRIYLDHVSSVAQLTALGALQTSVLMRD